MISELIKAIQEGRAQVIPATRGEAARQNSKHPAFIKTFLPDDVVKNMGKTKVFTVIVPPEPLIVTPEIIIPGGGR